MKKLDKKIFMPVYYQVGNHLKEKIISGELPLNSKLPAEETLAKEYGIARVTLRRAFDKLSQEGLIKRIKGKGSFVAGNMPKKEKTISFLLDRKKEYIPPPLSRVISGAVMSLKENGCSIRVDWVDDLEQMLEKKKNSGFDLDGVIALRLYKKNYHAFDILSKHRIPFISEGSSGPFNWIKLDCKAGIEKAFRYLIKLGHRKIGIGSVVSSPHEHDFILRTETAKNLLKAEFGEVREEYCFNFKYKGEKYALEQAALFLERPEKPTALLCVSDLSALPVIVKAPFAGVKVPDDISIIGFEDMEACTYVYPALTTIRQDYLKLGCLAAEELIRIIDDCALKPLQLKIDPELVVRDSCARLGRQR